MIPYSDPTIWTQSSVPHDLLITDGTVTVSGTSYTVTGGTIKITNTELHQEGFELHQSLCSETQIRFGSCESNYVTFIVHENVAGLKGKVLKVYIIPDHDASKMLQLGVFKVTEDTLSADRTQRNIMAYDAMYDILNADVAAWYNSELPNSSTTKTLAQFRADFLSHFSITAESTTLANDSITIKRTIEPETLSGADVIRAICEINGVFGTITNEGKFRFVELTTDLDRGLFPSDTLYPSNTLYPQDTNPNVNVIDNGNVINAQFEDFDSRGITQLTIRTNDSDVGVTVGTSGNRYVITSNFLVYGYTAANLTTVATNALNKIGGRYYKPSTIEAVGNPLYEVGDGLRANTRYRGIVTYILERKLTGIQALRDTYRANGEEYFGEQLNSVSSQFKQLDGKITQLKIDSDGIESRVEDIEDGSATVIQQLSGAIATKVETTTFNNALDPTYSGSYAQQTAQSISTKVETTTFNNALDPTYSGSYAQQTAQAISLKVTKSNMVSDLNSEMSGIDITSNSIAIRSTGTFTVDSSNFRLANNGALTIRSVTFDHSGSGYTDMTIDNGVITSGQIGVQNKSGVTVQAGYIAVGNYNDVTTINPGEIDVTKKVTIGNAILTSDSGGNLLVNGNSLLVNGTSSNITVGGVTVGNVFGSQDYVIVSPTSVSVQNNYSDSTFIYSDHIQTPSIHMSTFQSGNFTQVQDINGNYVYVLTFS